jgi:hypothetical protein
VALQGYLLLYWLATSTFGVPEKGTLSCSTTPFLLLSTNLSGGYSYLSATMGSTRMALRAGI